MALPSTAAPGSGVHLLDLPAELRVEIYNHVFGETTGFDLLMRKRGPDLALRRTCRFIYDESNQTYEKYVADHVPRREALLDNLIVKYEQAVSPHRSVVFWPPICRAATALRTINSHCLHKCAKDMCYMCEDPAHRHCFDCGRNVAAALWCYDNPHDMPSLVVKGSGGDKYTELGSFINKVRPVAYRRISNRVDRSKIDRYWQGELDVQCAIDYRCELRRSMVDKFWRTPQASRATFTEQAVLALENTHPGMAAYKKTADINGEGFLDWEVVYDRQVKHRMRCAAEGGIRLPPQVPTKQDHEKIKSLQDRYKKTTYIGRWNDRLRGKRYDPNPIPLIHERRVAQHASNSCTRGSRSQTASLSWPGEFPTLSPAAQHQLDLKLSSRLVAFSMGPGHPPRP